MQPPAIPSLSAADLALRLDPAWFPFESTATLEPLDGIVAQPRTVKALELGLGIRGSGYNIFAIGLHGTNLPRLIRDFAERRMAHLPVPGDWVYVNNFDEPDRPLALALPAGDGSQLKKDMREMPMRLAQILPRAMQYQGFNQEKERLQREYRQSCDALFAQIQEQGRLRDLHLELTEEGNFSFKPLRDLQPVTEEEFGQFDAAARDAFYQAQLDLLRDAQPLLESQQAATVELNVAMRKIERTFAEAVLTPLFEPLWKRCATEKAHAWLERAKQHMLDNIAPFFGPPPSQPSEENAEPPQPFGGGWDYEVNVVVDNGGRTAPPVLVEDVPTLRNLLGCVERAIDLNGRILTHFTHIKPGALLRANGGLLVFSLDDAIEEQAVWKELKRALKSRRLQIDSYDPNIPLGASGMRPEPIPLDVKLVVVGSWNLFYALSCMDADFGELFKVKAEFSWKMPLDAEGCLHYARLAKLLEVREGLPPFSADGVRELVRCGARLADDRRQLSADFSKVAGLAREAGHWCRVEAAPLVQGEHVRRAQRERVHRSDWFAEQTLELIRDGTFLIDVSGRAVGRINGLTVVSLGDWEFGRPARITASAWVGQTGVINVERESRLSGSTHDKGMLIMEGYLRGKYAQSAPIGLGASLAFEQSYSGVDGDSASAAELFCLVSALALLPLRQDVGVTGSVNQQGDIQAIGGVNEKIEGFFDVCRLGGLTGGQGVCFPRSNVGNLVLRPDVAEAVSAGKFHLWPIGTLDEGLELVTGLRASEVHGKVAERFRQIAEAMSESPPRPLERAASVASPALPTNPPEPPTLPPYA